MNKVHKVAPQTVSKGERSPWPGHGAAFPAAQAWPSSPASSGAPGNCLRAHSPAATRCLRPAGPLPTPAPTPGFEGLAVPPLAHLLQEAFPGCSGPSNLTAPHNLAQEEPSPKPSPGGTLTSDLSVQGLREEACVGEPPGPGLCQQPNLDTLLRTAPTCSPPPSHPPSRGGSCAPPAPPPGHQLPGHTHGGRQPLTATSGEQTLSTRHVRTWSHKQPDNPWPGVRLPARCS
ncbi:hypothetical protein EI555_019006 [Monodon monoceros]|uniref:Uncharacterized protein n=1 Tax=Monodon monoceros TaxID=40151 RepID=A0A4U1ENQ4_MONMO|nr:hypothetical protein EI555_019006 [Monodon monoceros]